MLRGDEAPYNVRVGAHFPPEYPEVAGLMQAWIEDLRARLARPEARGGNTVFIADVVGELLQRFEAIHPFVDGNGRTGRLVASYLTLVMGGTLIVFRAGERPAFYAAHRSKPAMKLFIADKLRGTMTHPLTGELLHRVGGDLAADIMQNADRSYQYVVERHPILPTLEQWQREAEEKDRARGLLK